MHLEGRRLLHHTFLLGNRGGFVLYLPAANNVRDETLHATKWFGASGFGRSFFEGILTRAHIDGKMVGLDRTNQTSLSVYLDRVVRTFTIGDHEIKETFFVPDKLQAVVYTVEGNVPLVVKPEFEMRYYQSFNTDFSQYRAQETAQGVMIRNRVENVGSAHASMHFFGLAGVVAGKATIEMLPEKQRLVEKTYLKDEQREKLIESTYREAQTRDPDESPLWDVYQTKAYAPALFHLEETATLVFAFGDAREEVVEGFDTLWRDLPTLRVSKQERIAQTLESGLLETGNKEADTAYAHVLTRFNDCLVARDATLHGEPQHQRHYYAIFAGNKYFMDAWKRDENISLGALLTTGEYETVRHILDNTWQHQDQRTGRLPHIIRAGEPLVYYSSDGTLWALQRLFEYTRDSGDLSLLEEKMPMVEHFFDASKSFVQRGLLPSGGIIDPTYLWETWEDTPYTPRAGFPVEIELLWLQILGEFRPFVQRVNAGLAGIMEQIEAEGRKTFEQYVSDGFLVDHLSYDWKQEDVLTPNGYIAFGIHSPLPCDLMRSMVAEARDQLAGYRGVRSLAPRDWPRVFPTEFLDDSRNVRGKDMASVGTYNYHRGIEWEWLNPFMVEGELKYGDVQHAYRLYLSNQVDEALHEMGIGGLSELHAMQGQVGADYQAWSLAGFIQSMHLFAGVQVDALERTVHICPSIPLEWPRLRCRARVANTRFDLLYANVAAGSYHLEIRPLEDPPPGFTLRVGVRAPAGAQIKMSRCNRKVLSAERWESRGNSLFPAWEIHWVTLPWTESILLDVEF